jgi:hypothetical protein
MANTRATVPNVSIHKIYCPNGGDFEAQVVLCGGTLCGPNTSRQIPLRPL